MLKDNAQRRYMLRWMLFAVIVLVLDQVTKLVALHYLAPYQAVSIFPGFNLTLAFNQGAAFSFLSAAGGWQRWFLGGIAVLMSAVLFIWLYRSRDQSFRLKLALALILGGALGNLWDRIYLGYVVDFVQLYVKNYYWPTFNVADSAITLGVVLLLFDALKPRKKQ